MHFGQPLSEERYLSTIQLAYRSNIRTFITADVYGCGAADTLLGRSLKGLPRDSYCLVGAIGHDFYEGRREGSKGFPRFTDPQLRPPNRFSEYVRMATEKSLERCGTDHFDLLLLHNPDWTGYSNEAVWKAMAKVQEAGLTHLLGVAPGPANGFSLDLLVCFERFGPLLDWAMIILNPLEPWPGNLCLSAAREHDIKLLTRVVDYGGLFHDDVKPGHKFGPQDHRTFRPAGWVEAGRERMEPMREIAERHGLTMLQLACAWNLSQPQVNCVVPTLIEEADSSKSIEAKIDELARLPEVKLSEEERSLIARIGDNRGCMELKGANPGHLGDAQPDRWGLSRDHELVAKRWGIDPGKDLVCTHKMAA